MRLRSLGFALGVSLGLGSLGCAATTTVDHVWTAPDWSGYLTRVAVFGISKHPGVRRSFETRMAAAFANAGVTATPSFELFEQEGELRDEDIARALEEHDQFDAAIVVRLVGVGTEYRYPSGGPYGGFGVPGDFYGCYHGMYSTMYSPYYATNYQLVILETNLYALGNSDAEKSELVWSGLSETFAPETANDAIDSYSKAMVKTMIKAGLVTPMRPPRRRRDRRREDR